MHFFSFGIIKPNKCLIVVVLPAPLGPKKPNISPFFIVKKVEKSKIY